MNIILASSSPARRSLLQQLHLNFEIIKPDIDESAQANEKAEDLVYRLAKTKAKVVADQVSNAIIIASDQVAVVNDEILGKPHHYNEAVRQLSLASANAMSFVNGVCVMNTVTKAIEVAVETCAVEFRELTSTMIDRYLQLDDVYHCAGSIKAEGYAVSLFKRFIGDDLTTIHGLPLIRLTAMLEKQGVRVV